MRKRVKEILEQRGLVSVMNKTKWTELCEAISRELPWAPAYQMKSVLSEQPDPEHFDPTPWYFGDWTDATIWRDTFDIEWLRLSHCYSRKRGRLIEPEVVSVEQELRDLLRRINAPRMYREDSTIVFGYIDATSRLESDGA